MLLDLKVLNGTMTPTFSSNVYEYNVEVDDVDTLELEYIVDKELPVTIYGNEELTDGENHVLLEIYEERVTTYTLNVYKNADRLVMSDSIHSTKAEINDNGFLNDILTPCIAVSCFMIIIILYSIVFHK